MADTVFFKRQPPKNLKELAALSGADIADGADPSLLITDVAPLDTASIGQISFFDNVKYRPQLQSTKATACILSPEAASHAPSGTALLLSKSPYKSYALVAQAFYPDQKPQILISPAAHVDAAAEIGAGTVVDAGAVIGPGVKIGVNCRIGANAVISHALIGDNVRVYPGCCIGQDGFGFAIDPAGHVKVPQLGRVIIEDGAEIGANTCIDRGAGPDTVIGRGTWIDNLVQIGHNVKIGRGCIIVSQVGISGSTVIDDYVVLAGQVGIAGHLRIGKGVRVAAQSGIMRDVPAGEEVMGSPALPIKQKMRQVAFLNRMIKKGKDQKRNNG
ncbi:MAG: UDP-3-O-(3-hydroxymyristoyl)glucosamine N-acyltransferase [Proteobacteria bacterium]|nr:UDP-3-O-(3-hydroxymyristoyl)glucosamine N-acyltransferase [Pseudomonadota bacterium]